MPFDILDTPVRAAPAVNERPSLTETFSILGIEPVSEATAEQHMSAEVKRYPADFFYLHQKSLPVARVLWLSAGFFDVTEAFVSAHLDALSASQNAAVCVGVLLVLIATAWKFRIFHDVVRGRAYWDSKTSVTPPMDTPSPIVDLAYEVKRTIRDVKFVTNRLRRPNAVVADPVLWAERDDEMVCLGIWDGNKIIACAKHI